LPKQAKRAATALFCSPGERQLLKTVPALRRTIRWLVDAPAG